MSYFSAYIFPQTIPDASCVLPLVHVFPSLVYLQPIEDDPSSSFAAGSLIQALINRNQLKFFTPAPLKQDRDRFLALIADLYNRQDDYASQLSALSLASLSSGGKGESRQSIISHLVGNQQTRQDQRAMTLWQARLVLKLGERFDQEQEEINRQLASMGQKQDNLLQELREETGTPFSLTHEISEGSRKPDTMFTQRLKAWTQIYCLGNAPMPDHARFFIADNPDAAEKLIDRWENSQQPSPAPVRLALPGYSKEYTGENLGPAQLPASAEKTLQSICAVILNGNPSGEKLDSRLRTWQQELDQQYPAAQYGRTSLNLYPFPGTTAKQLFKDTFARGLQESLTAEEEQPGCVIGILAASPEA